MTKLVALCVKVCMVSTAIPFLSLLQSLLLVHWSLWSMLVCMREWIFLNLTCVLVQCDLEHLVGISVKWEVKFQCMEASEKSSEYVSDYICINQNLTTWPDNHKGIKLLQHDFSFRSVDLGSNCQVVIVRGIFVINTPEWRSTSSFSEWRKPEWRSATCFSWHWYN